MHEAGFVYFVISNKEDKSGRRLGAYFQSRLNRRSRIRLNSLAEPDTSA